jgi:hypothetical protein
MRSRSFVAGALLLAVLLPTGSQAQAPGDMRDPDGTSTRPWPTPSTRAPNLDVEVTGSILPGETGSVVPPASTRVTIDRPGCDVQSYVVGSGSRVRVHRC